MDRPVWSWHSYCYAPPLIGGALSDHAVWRLRSVAYIGPKSRTERHRKTKIGTEVAHVPRDADTAFKVKRSRSPGRFTHRGVNASGSCSGQRGNVLTVGTYCCYVAVGLAARGASVPTEGRRGAGHIVAEPAQLVFYVNWTQVMYSTAYAGSLRSFTYRLIFCQVIFTYS